MHIHAQTQVELDRTGVHVLSGSDQHAAITNSITTSIAISTSPRACLELSGWGSCQHVRPERPVRAARTASQGGQSGQSGQSGQPERPGGPGRTLDRENTWFCGPGRTLDRETRGFVGPNVRWTVKTRGFVDPDLEQTRVRWAPLGPRRASKF